MKSRRLKYDSQIAPSHPNGSQSVRPPDSSVELLLARSAAETGTPAAAGSPDEGRIPAAIPCMTGLDVAAGAMLGRPFNCGGPGGDFLDVFQVNGGYGLSIGAVAGRGRTTAALAKVAKFTLQAEAFRDAGSIEPDGCSSPSVDLTMRSAGALLSQSLRRQANLSVLYGHYELTDRCLTFCNCSRWPPVLMRNGVVTFLEERHPQMGEHWHRQYPPVKLDLVPGDVFVAYTDGLPEALRGRAVLGVGPIRRILQKHAGGCAADLIQPLLALPRHFCGDEEPSNDALVLVARVAESTRADHRFLEATPS